jgi:integrase
MTRNYGSGSVQKRGENSWRLRYYDNAGMRHTVTFRGTKKEADAKLRDLLTSVAKGSHVAPDKMTLSA